MKRKNAKVSNVLYAIGIMFNWLFIGSLFSSIVWGLIFLCDPNKFLGIISLIALIISPISFFISMGIFGIAINLDPTPSPSGKYDHKEYEFS